MNYRVLLEIMNLSVVNKNEYSIFRFIYYCKSASSRHLFHSVCVSFTTPVMNIRHFDYKH